MLLNVLCKETMQSDSCIGHTNTNKSDREDLIYKVWGREDLNHNSNASVARYNYAQGQLIF
jgi:hypothetical protein